jgi:hypothetical protein
VVETCRGGAISCPLFRKSSAWMVLLESDRFAIPELGVWSCLFWWPLRPGAEVDILDYLKCYSDKKEDCEERDVKFFSGFDL